VSTILATLSSIPLTSATPEITTYAYIQATPSTVGVGQTAYVYMWLDKVISNAAVSNDIRFHDFKLVITAPDGTTTTETFSEITDTTSNQGYSFTPDQVGTYNLTFTFPGQTYTWSGTYEGYYYLPSNDSTTLTVQEDAIYTYPDSYPLPTEYWTRPIYGENSYWYTISSNWLGTGSPQLTQYYSASRVVTDGVGSLTSHIMWTTALQSGGVVGGDESTIAGETYFEGSAYIPRYTNPIIVNGMLYYTEPLSIDADDGPTVCVDLQTGEVIWSRSDVLPLSLALIYDMQNVQQHGTYPAILISTGSGSSFMGQSDKWYAYDADTGESLFNVTNLPSGTKASGPNGEVLTYVIANAGNTTNPDYRLGQWNSSKLWSGSGSGMDLSPSITGTVDGSISDPNSLKCRYDWNVSLSWMNSMTTTTTVLAGYYDDMLLCYNGTLPSSTSSASYTYFAINLDESKGDIGKVLWRKTLDAPDGNITITTSGVDPTNRVFIEGYKETMQWVAYDMDTGDQLWDPTESQAALDYYGIPGVEDRVVSIADGKVYSAEFSGIIYCYDELTGELLWTYGNGDAGNSTGSGFAVPGNYPTCISAIGNGVIYTVTTEHTVTTPIYKGALARAINATDGSEIWTLSSFTNSFHSYSYAMADGYNTWFNGLDNQIYVVGKGASQTTVTAPNLAAASGQSVFLSGTVTDISSGTTQDEQAARFPNGVPVASDASMTDWMGYVYQQKQAPTNFTGVEVAISVVDANGNYRTIGTTTTDASGYYSIAWTPDISGKYSVYATFAGTNGYWGSSAETGFVVDAPVATATPQPTAAPSAADLYFLPATIGVIIAILVVGVVLALLTTKKHP
jgi:outer membrane protein assembly factor BamB